MTYRVEVHNRVHGWLTLHHGKTRVDADRLVNILRCDGRDARVTPEGVVEEPSEWR